MVIAHEAAHIRRKDWLWQVLGQTACAIHFFSPLAWVALKQLRKESELACDDFVLGLGFEPGSCAQALLDIARKRRFQMANTVGMARSANVEGRLKSIVDASRNRNRVSGRAAIGVLLTAGAIALPLAVVKAMPRIVGIHAGAESSKHSGPVLPQIPWVRSKEVSTNTFLAQNGVAGLPGGYRVKLIGISASESPDIWGLDGKPLPGAELWVARTGKYWNGNVFARRSQGGSPRLFSAFARTFFVEVESESDSSPSTTFDMERPAATTQMQRLNLLMAGGSEKIPEVAFSAYDPSYAPLGICVPSRAETGTVRFGVTADNWQTVSDIKNPVTVDDSGISRVGFGSPKNGDQCTVSLDNSPSLWYLDVQMKSHEIKLLEGVTLSSDTARRILLFDKDGQPIDPGRPGTMMDGFPMYGISAKNFSRIARAVVQTTPYIWAEFRDVPLLPDFEKNEAARLAEHAATLESGILGSAIGVAPGFTKTLSDGTTVSVTSVTRAIVDNQNWVMTGQHSWRADGEILAERPNVVWYPIPYSPNYPDPLEKIGVDFAGMKSDASTVVRFTSQFNPKTHQPVFEDRDSWNIRVTPKDRFGAAQIGVASGPWETASREDIEMRELPAIESDDFSNDPSTGPRTGFEVVVGKDCYVHDLTTDTRTAYFDGDQAPIEVRRSGDGKAQDG